MIKKRSLSILFLLVLINIPNLYISAQTFHQDYLDGSILVRLEENNPIDLRAPVWPEAYKEVLDQHQITKITRPFMGDNPELSQTYRIYFNDISNTGDFLEDLNNLDGVSFAELYPLYKTTATPNDIHPAQYGLVKINAMSAWDISTGTKDVILAIVDNAVLIDHEDLVGNLWVNPDDTENGLDEDLNGYADDVNGYDVSDLDNNPRPPVGTTDFSPFVHGTHCAGISAATTNNGKGISSIGYNLSIMSVKCAPDLSTGNILPQAYEGVQYATMAGADVISMSWGSSGSSITGQTIILNAASRGIVLVAAAGNDNVSSNHFPAAYANVIGVGSTDAADLKSSFSNYGSYIDVMAPGSGIYSTLAGSNSSYGNLSGTSMACPLVAGLAGLLLSSEPMLTPIQVEERIKDGCDDISAMNPGFDGQLGAGRINAFRTMQPSTVGQDEKLVDALFNIYPNPSNGLFSLDFDSDLNHQQGSIYNLQGAKVFSFELNQNSLDLTKLQSGIYLLQLDAIPEKRQKLVIQ